MWLYSSYWRLPVEYGTIGPTYNSKQRLPMVDIILGTLDCNKPPVRTIVVITRSVALRLSDEYGSIYSKQNFQG